MHSKSDNIEVMTYYNANEIIKENFESLLSRYRIGLETSMKGSNIIFDSVQLFYYKSHKINFKRGGSPDLIKKKKATRNPKDKDDKCLQYAATVALNYREIK